MPWKISWGSNRCLFLPVNSGTTGAVAIEDDRSKWGEMRADRAEVRAETVLTAWELHEADTEGRSWGFLRVNTVWIQRIANEGRYTDKSRAPTGYPVCAEWTNSRIPHQYILLFGVTG